MAILTAAAAVPSPTSLARDDRIEREGGVEREREMILLLLLLYHYKYRVVERENEKSKFK